MSSSDVEVSKMENTGKLEAARIKMTEQLSTTEKGMTKGINIRLCPSNRPMDPLPYAI